MFSAAVTLLFRTKVKSSQVALQTQLKRFLVSTQAFFEASKESGGNPNAAQFFSDIDSAFEDAMV
jgi:hypothetical protein